MLVLAELGLCQYLTLERMLVLLNMQKHYLLVVQLILLVKVLMVHNHQSQLQSVAKVQ